MFNKDFLILSILTFITVVFWTFFEAYHIHTASTVPASLQLQIEPITPILQKTTLENLKNRYRESAFPTPAVTIPIPTPTISIPSATSSATPIIPRVSP